MKHLFAWVAIFAALFAAGLVIVWYVGADIPPILMLIGAMVIAAIFLANELKRPRPKEFNRHTALYPPIPDQYLHDKPISESVIFGTDHHTGKLVQAEQGHHVLIGGSTGSGKTSTSLIPSILSCKTGSKQIVDIKSRELAYKTADIYNPNTIVIDMNLQAPYVWGWDIFYKLKKDGTDTEQEVLSVVREVASVIIPKSDSGDGFWADAARNELIGLTLFEFCYNNNYEFIDICRSMLTIPLREHMETALNTVKKTSLVAAFLTGLAATADETLFSVDITLNQALFIFLSDDIVYFLRDNPKRANPIMLDKEGVSQYICVSEEKLDSGYDKIICIVLKQSLMQIQSRTTTGTYPQILLLWDEWQRLTASAKELRDCTATFLATARSKHATVVLCVQNLDNFKKEVIYDILSNIHYFYVLASNNANSLTTEVVCKMAGSYYEKEKSYSQSNGTSVSTSYKEKQILRPEDLNQLGDDAVLLITNYGYVRTNKNGSAYYKTEPFKSQYEKIVAVNNRAMPGV